MKTCKPAYLFIAAFLFLIAGFLTACSGNFGRIEKDGKIDEFFKSAAVLPDSNYYYAGPEGIPTAILKIEKNYELVSGQWKPFVFPEENLGKWAENMRFHNRDRLRYRPYGYRIVNCDGETVGGWYSIWDWTTVECLEDNKVNVFPPPLGEPFGNGYDDDRKLGIWK